MGINYYVVPKHPTVREPIHIGKSSIGWKFLFQTQHCTWTEPQVIWHSYEEVREWLYKHTVEDPKFVILDECDDQISFDDFFGMVQVKQDVENPENFAYCENVGGYRFQSEDFC